jgi:putative transposase
MQRCESYRELFRYQLEPGLVEQIRTASNSNYALGSPRFTAEIESAIGRRVTRGKAGRPRPVP